MIAAVVLAAGGSTRLGEPKQLLRLGNETLLERAVRTAGDAGCKPIVVVLGSAYEEILAHTRLGDAVPVINDEWSKGMATSIRFGVQTLGSVAIDAEGVLLMTCDQPTVTVSHLRLLMRERVVKASRYANKKGIPAYFPQKYFKSLMALSGDVGAREILAEASFVELAHGELDIDTLEDFAHARELLG